MIPFQEGVKFVTAVRHEKDEKVTFVKQRLSRSLKDFADWVKAGFPKDEKGASAALRAYKEKGFGEKQKITFRDAFQNWKKEVKSRKASAAGNIGAEKKAKAKRKTDRKRDRRADKGIEYVLREIERKYGRKGAIALIEAAEAAAVEENPDYADAHFDLAVIYSTSQPPAKELARRHYNKALALGVAPDATLDKLLR